MNVWLLQDSYPQHFQQPSLNVLNLLSDNIGTETRLVGDGLTRHVLKFDVFDAGKEFRWIAILPLHSRQ